MQIFYDSLLSFPVRVRSKGVALSTASNWAFNTALAWAVPPALANISYRTYFIFAAFNAGAAVHVFFMCAPYDYGRAYPLFPWIDR
jgi:uncharacterized membrane protein